MSNIILFCNIFSFASLLLLVFQNEEEEEAEEGRFAKIMGESTLVSARMEALVQTCLIVKKTAERKI